jgi:DNA-directed RNA polymerase subunit K/omega
MSDEELQRDPASQDDSEAPREPAPPIESRFLYVDVSALRAKQLRRGAKPRLSDAPHPHEGSDPPPRPTKAERIAMQEVKSGLVEWDLPDFKAVFDNR